MQDGMVLPCATMNFKLLSFVDPRGSYPKAVVKHGYQCLGLAFRLDLLMWSFVRVTYEVAVTFHLYPLAWTSPSGQARDRRLAWRLLTPTPVPADYTEVDSMPCPGLIPSYIY